MKCGEGSWWGPSLFCGLEGAMAEKPELSEVEFAAVIDLLRPLNADEREPVILALEHDYEGVGDRARAALALEEKKVVKLRVEPKSIEPKIDDVQWRKRPDGEWEHSVNGGIWRRGAKPKSEPVVQLRVVEQAK